jgi:hypothetical protein
MFSDRAKLIALAIVHIFETSKPFGDYSAVAVLDDGAGVSYGINQFTHKSGSLYMVLNTYLGMGGSVGADEFELRLPTLKQKSSKAIVALSNDHTFKNLLKAAGKTDEMRIAQQQVMENAYLLPAVDAAEGSHFECPLSLAVIYDSINHGSFERIRDKVTISRSFFPSNGSYEQAWIKDYVTTRHAWLKSNTRLAKTSYRTAFFLEQIVLENWNLDLPLHCHGVDLTEKMFPSSAAAPAVKPTPTSEDTTQLVQLDPSEKPLSGDLPEIASPSITTTSIAAVEGESVHLESSSFTPQTITQYIPKMSAAKRWLGSLAISGTVSTAWAALNGLPIWAIFILGMLTAIVIVGLVIVFVKYKQLLFDLVKHVITVNADPSTNNIQLTAEKE